MNSVTKIGKMSLQQIFARKPYNNGKKIVMTSVVFSKDEIDFNVHIPKEEKKIRIAVSIWSIKLGLIRLDLKKGQSLLQGMAKKLNKQQRTNEPSHVIVSKYANVSDVDFVDTREHTVYRLTKDQEIEIYCNHLLPSMQKRDETYDNKMTAQGF